MSLSQLLSSINETRRLLGGRGRGRIYEWIADGSLESVTDGGRRFIVTDSISRLVERMRLESQSEEMTGHED